MELLIQAVVLKLAMLAKGLPIVGLRTDFRGSGEHGSEPYAHPELRPLAADHIHVQPEFSQSKSHPLKIGEDFALLEVLSSLPAAYTARSQQSVRPEGYLRLQPCQRWTTNRFSK